MTGGNSFIRNATIIANRTPCSSPPQVRLRRAGTSAAENALVACFDITVGRLEDFDPTGIRSWRQTGSPGGRRRAPRGPKMKPPDRRVVVSPSTNPAAREWQNMHSFRLVPVCRVHKNHLDTLSPQFLTKQPSLLQELLGL